MVLWLNILISRQNKGPASPTDLGGFYRLTS